MTGMNHTDIDVYLRELGKRDDMIRRLVRALRNEHSQGYHDAECAGLDLSVEAEAMLP